jgi:hypothetical protein
MPDPAAHRRAQQRRRRVPPLQARAPQPLQDPAGELAPERVDDRRDLGVRAAARAHELQVPRRVGLDVGEVGVEGLEGPLRLGHRLGDGGDRAEVLHAGPHDLHVEVALRAEVVVEQALRDPAPRGDVVDGDLVEGPCGEELLPEREELLTTRVEGQAGADGHGRQATGAPRGGPGMISGACCASSGSGCR